MTASAVVLFATHASPVAAQAQQRRIVRIEVQRENVFDREEASALPARVVNAAHARTQEFVVRRELLFHVGEPFDSATAAETARNLRRLGFFRDVRIDTVSVDSGVVVQVTTRDRWTTKGSGGVRTTGNQVLLNLSLTETNVFGTGNSLGFRYRREPDRTLFRVALAAPRLAFNADLRTQVDRLSDGDITLLGIASPYRSVSDRKAFGVEGTRSDRRVLRFERGDPAPTDSFRRVFDYARLWGGRAFNARSTGYTRLEGVLLLRREDFAPYAGTPTIERSRFAALGAAVEASRVRFLVTEGIGAAGVTQDVNLSHTVRAGLWASPSAWGYDRDGVGAELSLSGGTRAGPGFAWMRVDATGRFAGGLDSGTVRAQAGIVAQPSSRHVLALYVAAGADSGAFPGEEFDLGLTTAPRGFGAHSFTGNRMYQGSAEWQWRAWPDVGGLGVLSLGIAAFADHGAAWFTGSGVRRGTSAGLGLRLGSSRAAATALTRIDLARRFANDAVDAGWVLVVGNGFLFELPR